jgi:hypothetical protein
MKKEKKGTSHSSTCFYTPFDGGGLFPYTNKSLQIISNAFLALHALLANKRNKR